MAEQSLADFFRAKSQQTQQPPADLNERLDKFLRDLNSLYDTIESLLNSANGSIQIKRETCIVTEQNVKYEAEKLTVCAGGDETVAFIPKGFHIFGASGRVDVHGERGDGMLVLQPEDRWCVVTGIRPTLRVVPLDEDALLALLTEIMRP